VREHFLDDLRVAWKNDLRNDGLDEQTIARRLQRSDEILGRSPVLLACFVSLAGADRYADERRARAEREMFVAAAGAAVQNLMVALAAEAIGSCWISSSLFAPEIAARALGLEPEWLAVGCVAAGFPSEPAQARPTADPDDFLDVR
jgi:coenzyme F420-0:L-glutamate ligase/coenzyme F420-1:gamma-L-glutamate ligase